MNELFGVSMNLIMWVLLGLLALALSTVGVVFLRNRVMFKVGVRNIPRRQAQTILIVLGLMLSTLIISAAFTTGDTVDRSITSQAYNLLGSVDELVTQRGSDQSFEEEDAEAATRDPSFDLSAATNLIRAAETSPLVDAVIPVYADIAAAVNLDKRLSSPVFTLTGVDGQRFGDLPDLRSGRQRYKVTDLAQGEMFLNRSGAEELNAKAGDTITVTALGNTRTFRVKAVVDDRRLAGSGGISSRREGGVVPLNVAQEMFNASGRVTYIAVSNSGDARSGLTHSKEVSETLRRQAAMAEPALGVSEVKRQTVEFAEQGASFFTTFFLALGLFSIGAGILLIFMIFVMLAAERKAEMGMARAVGTKRGDLVQTFLSEGMSYNMLAAAVGSALGVVVAVIIAEIMASIFESFNIEISPHVTPRSLIISYSLGVVLTFFTVTFSSWRISNINIVRAIRDIPDPPMQRPDWRGKGILTVLRDLVFKPTDRSGWVHRGLFFLTLALAVAGAAGAGPALYVAALPWLAMLGMIAGSRTEFGVPLRVLLFMGMVFLSPISAIIFVFQSFQFGPLLALLGAILTFFGAGELNAFMLYGGLSFLTIGLALLIRSFGANERITYTTAGLVLLYIWLFEFEFGLIEVIFGETSGDIEMFFLSGVMITVASVFLLVYNSDVFLPVFTRMGGVLGKNLPSIRMAVAYPLANRARTGMTMAMFCLVVFALIVMSAMNYNFSHVFVSERALGGWDVVVDENPTNPIPDLVRALRDSGSAAPDDFQEVGAVGLATFQRARACEVRPGSNCSTTATSGLTSYRMFGEDARFLATAELTLQTRAVGYDSDDAAWQAVSRDPTLAIVDANAISGGFGEGFIRTVKSDQRTMEPLEIVVFDRKTEKAARLKVIGVIELASSNTYFGVHMSAAAFEQVFGAPDFRRFYVKTRPGANERAVAREIESALLTTGIQAESLQYLVDRESGLFASFLRLIQGFMGLGLFVGVAAVGVIAFRTVVERRQQIGMLRALGYTRGMVGLTFLLESAFIAAGGITTGIVFGLILARYLIHDEFANQGVVDFVIPYTQVAVIGLLSFGSALLMTLLPSRQAASIPIAAALRYE